MTIGSVIKVDVSILYSCVYGAILISTNSVCIYRSDDNHNIHIHDFLLFRLLKTCNSYILLLMGTQNHYKKWFIKNGFIFYFKELCLHVFSC